MASFNFDELTSGDLEDLLTTLDRLSALEVKLVNNHVVESNEIDLNDLGDAIIDEMSRRVLEDTGYIVNAMVARGELDRYVRPDGQIGYVPPGAWDEMQS